MVRLHVELKLHVAGSENHAAYSGRRTRIGRSLAGRDHDPAYGQTWTEAIERAKALALWVLADRVEHGEPIPQMDDLFAVVP